MSSNKDSFNVADLSTGGQTPFLEILELIGCGFVFVFFNWLLVCVALNAEDRADLVNALKNKLQDLAGKHSDVLENLSPNSQHDDLEAKFFEERAALEAKYQKLYQPLYTKAKMVRECLISIWNIILMMRLLSLSFSNLAEKGVPDFWLTAMKNNEVLAEEISERDEGALKFLKDIKWSRIDNPKGFKLEFFFDTNTFFKNSVLTKTYHMIDEDEPILEKAIGTEIEWYPGKCLTQKILKKKPKKGSKNAKPITKTEQCESFFNFFSPPQVPDEDDDIDEDAAEELQNLMEQDYDIGGCQDEYGDIEDDEDDLDEEDEDDDEDDEEEDEEDDDDEEDEDESKTRKKKSGRAPPGDGQQGERPPECKQQ
ncbi:UNVERIFIED_CONTAM: Nucleosome assembly protein 1 [Sesamum radiatum]|uniref:Nucleosome assembly protein 1 n=1 Tax=Sesamum radiatum TaxID=300843 RepID=A0AAW2L9L3_SESRA